MLSPVLRQGTVSRRAFVWAIWAINAACTAVYTAIGISILASLQILLGAIPAADPYASLPRGLQASIALGILVSVGFSTIMLLLMLWSSFGKSGAGFSYGFMVSSAGQTGISMALIGCFMVSINGWLSTQGSYPWSASSSSQFSAVYAFAFISAFFHLVFFIILSVWEGMSPEKGGNEGLFMQGNPYAANYNGGGYPPMAPMQQQQQMQQQQMQMQPAAAPMAAPAPAQQPANPFV